MIQDYNIKRDVQNKLKISRQPSKIDHAKLRREKDEMIRIKSTAAALEKIGHLGELESKTKVVGGNVAEYR